MPDRSELASIDVGARPDLIQDSGNDQILIISDAVPTKEQPDPDGFLRVIKGGQPVAIC